MRWPLPSARIGLGRCLAAWLLAGASCRPSPDPDVRSHAGKAPHADSRGDQRPRTPHNVEVAALLGAANVAEAEPAGYGLTGAGVRAGVWDEGHARVTHVDLRGRVLARDLGGPSEHATHTTATLAGSGTGRADARGIAPALHVAAYDFHLDLNEMEAAAFALSFASNAYGPTMGWAVEPACREHPTWWGGAGEREDAAFGRYAAEAALFDALAQRTGLLTVWPAGNERADTGVAAGEPHYHAGSCDALFTDAHLQEITLQFGTLGGAGVAKNALTVAAARAVARDALRPERIVALDVSSFGPTDDGRIKPDLCAGGEAVRSASAAGDEEYAVATGTSSATAATAGVVALLVELYRRVHGGVDPRADELKALLIHTAREAGADPGPDYRTGYGLLDAQAAADHVAADGALDGTARHLRVGRAAAGELVSFTSSAAVPARTGLRATLVWFDPPGAGTAGAAGESPALINDLDLSLVAPDGSVFHPWSLDAARPQAAAVRDGPNRRDTVEVVDVDAADNPGGRWQVRVQAAAELLRAQAQPFALVASVALPAADRPALALPRYVELALAAGETPAPLRVPLVNREGGALSFRALARVPWLAVSPTDGSAPAELVIEVDPAAVPVRGELAGEVLVESDEAAASQVLGVIVHAGCEPDCDGRSCGLDPRCGQPCGGCAAGTFCADGTCQGLVQSCPQAALDVQLGESLISFDAADAPGFESGSCGGEASPDLGASWTAPVDGRYAFSTRGSSLDSLLYVRDGGCQGEELGCNDDSGGVTSALALELQAGSELALFVDAFAARSGRFELNVQPAACPSGELGSRLGQDLVRASTAGGIDLLAGSCGGAGSEDVTLGWTAPAAGLYRFSLFDPAFQAVLYLRDGACDGSELGCSPAPDVGPVERRLAQGQRVVVVIDGRAARSGGFGLDIVDAERSCAGACGGPGPGAVCACDAACVAARDCCADACVLCGHCRCQPSCDGRECGPDGCGGRCGDCPPDRACDAGRCAPDPCAGRSCDACSVCADGRCVPLAQGAACEDGDLCSVRDVCRDGECRGEPRVCDDGFACTRDSCDPRSGLCEFSALAGCCEPSPSCADGGTCRLAPAACEPAVSDAGEQGDAIAGMRPRRADGGCGCRTARDRHEPAPLAFAAVAILTLLYRRHRRRRRCRTAA